MNAPARKAPGKGPKPAAHPAPKRREEAPPPPPPTLAQRVAAWLPTHLAAAGRAFWVGVGLCLALGLGLGLWAWRSQVRARRAVLFQASVNGVAEALAAQLRTRSDLPFQPTRSHLALLGEQARLRRALALLAAGEENPDADRQTQLEGRVAEGMPELARAREAARAGGTLADLRAAYGRAQADLETLHRAGSQPEAAWKAEVAQALARVQLPPETLEQVPERLAKVEAALAALEEALGAALADARLLAEPGLEVVSFLPAPGRTHVIGDGWGATGAGMDGRVPGRTITFALEGRSLVHRLLNAGTWSGLARVEAHGSSRHYRVDTETDRLTEAAAGEAQRVLEAGRALAAAWRALNPFHAGPPFAPAPRKAFDDLLVDLERDLAFGTPEGLPDPEQWPTEGEIAKVKDGFGPGVDLVLLRFRRGGELRVQVLALEGLAYTSGPTVAADRLLVLPGGVLLALLERGIPAPVGEQAFPRIEVLERPRVQRRPSGPLGTGAQPLR